MCAHTPIYVSSYCRRSSSPYTATHNSFFCLSWLRFMHAYKFMHAYNVWTCSLASTHGQNNHPRTPQKKKETHVWTFEKKPLEMVIFTRNDVLPRQEKKKVRYIVAQERKDIQVYRVPEQIYTTLNTNIYWCAIQALFRLYSGSIQALLKLY